MELEMYRRYSQMARGIEKAELVFKNGRVFSSGTVSYTHLDVYKRQVSKKRFSRNLRTMQR